MPTGFAARCDEQGRVVELLRDSIGLLRLPKVGDDLDTVLISADRQKLKLLLGELGKSGVAFGWTMNVDTIAGVAPLDFAGVTTCDGIVVMAGENSSEMADVAEQFVSMNSELVNVVRELRGKDALSSRILADFTALNNTLVDLQRELARKNNELDHNRRFLESILDTTPSLVYIYDLAKEQCAYANSAVERVLGFARGKVAQPLSESDQDLLDFGGLHAVEPWYADVVDAADSDVVVHEYEVPNAPCELLWLQCYDKVLTRDAFGRASQILRVANDITDRRTLEIELQKQANTDSLTGAANRRHLLEIARAEFNRARRYDHALELIMLDLDNLKQLNDEYGHASGDEAIRHLARTCGTSIRTTDLLARFGGDEFVVLMPETVLPEAREVAERIAGDLAANPIAIGGGTATITACCGVSALGGKDDTLDALLRRADQALYDAKSEGRGRVEAREPASA